MIEAVNFPRYCIFSYLLTKVEIVDHFTKIQTQKA